MVVEDDKLNMGVNTYVLYLSISKTENSEFFKKEAAKLIQMSRHHFIFGP
jgi:hypothetical protein